MKKFLTLIKRDLTDYRGALVITPFAISLFILLVTALSAISGKINLGGNEFGFGNQSSFEFTDDSGKDWKIKKNADGKFIKTDGSTEIEIGNKLDGLQTDEVSRVLGFAISLPSALPIGIALISIYFVLSGALYEERKERNIMFWKSLPISDLETVGAKITSIVGGGITMAVLASLLLQIGLMLIISALLAGSSLFVLDFGLVLQSATMVWLTIILALIAFVLWAFPVYAWFLAVSAYAPKSPFFAAILPIILLPIVGKILFDDSVSFLKIPAQHMLAEPALVGFARTMKTIESKDGDTVQKLANIDYEPILASLREPQLWIGVVIGLGLLYLASEIRRRKAL